ncbi:urease accessory UreF family protein [soil metagenome]
MVSSAMARMLLADGRFPSGAHAHSAGVEAAVGAGLVRDLRDLEGWLVGCLHRHWLTEAAAAVHAAGLVSDEAPGEGWVHLDGEMTARTTSPLQRRASRVLGRQMLRAGGAVWPHPTLTTAAAVHPDGPVLPLAQGAVGAAAGLDPADVAGICVYGSVQGASTAAIRLLGLDPYAVAGLLGRLASTVEQLTEAAVLAGAGSARDLPAQGAPVLDLLLAAHDRADMRLFAT